MSLLLPALLAGVAAAAPASTYLQGLADESGWKEVASKKHDSVGEIRTVTQSQMPLQQQVLEQITNRRILFATNGIDVTDQVIVRMNNAANTNP